MTRFREVVITGTVSTFSGGDDIQEYDRASLVDVQKGCHCIPRSQIG